MKEKSILEEALLQVENLEDALKQNAKGILSSVMKKELNDLLKESLEEEEEEASEEESSQPEEEVEKDMKAEDEMSMPEDDEEDSDNDEPAKDVDSMDSEDDMSDEDMGMGDSEMEDDMSDDDMGMEDSGMEDDMSMGGDDDVMDMTGASDEEVLKVFKAMKPEDGIVVKKDGNKVELETGDDEFIIKLDEEEEEAHESDFNEEWNEEEDENLYEIELDEEDDEMKEEEEEEVSEEEDEELNEGALKGLKAKGVKKSEPKESALKGLGKPKKVEAKEEEEEGKEEATEAARTKWNPHGGDRAGLKSKKVFKAGSKHGGSLNEEVETLRKQNQEYKKALVLFKDKLNEVAVFNANLAYATRLFTEHSTTKQEKLNILKRFDTVSNLSESKGLYNTIKTELGTKKPVTESVVNKITSTPSTSTSKEMLAESKVYEDQNFRRVKELMRKIK